MQAAVRQTLRTVLTVNWTQFQGLAALRCAAGVAVPLLVGLAIEQPVVGVFGAVGAIGVGFGSFQGAYRGRAAVMLIASVAMAFSFCIGSLAGHSNAATIGVAAVWGLGGGLLVSVGQGASFVGLQAIVAVVIAGGYPTDLAGALVRTVLVLVGGLGQTFLVVMIWPLRRFPVERRHLAAAYRSLAAYAATLPARQAVPPEPHTFASMPSPLADPQPFVGSDRIFIFQTLLDEAERIRASLASLVVRHLRLQDADQEDRPALAALSAQALTEIAAALEEGREPREPDRLSQSIVGGVAGAALLGQIRTAWRTVGMLSGGAGDLPPRNGHIVRHQRRLAMGDALITLRANLTIRSTAFRHALRLAMMLSLAAAGARVVELPRGYWLPMTIALVLKPDFHDTFAFSVGRVAGTLLGAAGATAIAVLLSPGPGGLIVLVLGCVWAAYALMSANYGAFSVCITGYVVFLLSLAGTPEAIAATDRIVATATAGALALGAYLAWPSWAATKARPAVAEMLEAQSVYLRALLEAYAESAPADIERLKGSRAAARLARSNAEAVVDRMLTEPRRSYTMSPLTAVGIVGATHRNALAALSLHAGLELDRRGAVTGVQKLADQAASSMLSLADAVRGSAAPSPLPPLRQTQVALAPAFSDLVNQETDLIVDSIDTIAELLAKDVSL